MKSLSKTVLAVYILTLLWLVLFKFSFDLSSIVLDHQDRGLNLIPFLSSDLRELIDNFAVFIPFGLFLSVNLKRIKLWWKLAVIFIFSITVEIIQFILAIGVTDITDVLTNISGGLLGLILYDLSKKYLNNKKLDWFIIIAGAILLVLLLLVRFLILKVRY